MIYSRVSQLRFDMMLARLLGAGYSRRLASCVFVSGVWYYSYHDQMYRIHRS